jgi:enoyl-CoA hydratase
MTGAVTYTLGDTIATIAMDDGKVNALSLQMLQELDGAFDQAQTDQAVVVLTGRDGVFSGGFDLRALGGGDRDAAAAMLVAGFELAERILTFPRPVVVACPGHAIAMGVFLLLSGDYRIGADGPYRITANEVAIGLTMPRAAVEICRQRLTPAHFNRAVLLAEVYSPTDAVAAGFLDQAVPAADLQDEARTKAAALAKLNMDAHTGSKMRLRDHTLTAVRAAIEADAADFRNLTSNADAGANQ